MRDTDLVEVQAYQAVENRNKPGRGRILRLPYLLDIPSTLLHLTLNPGLDQIKSCQQPDSTCLILVRATGLDFPYIHT